MPRFDIINDNEEQCKQEKWKLVRKSTITSSKLNKKGKLEEAEVISIIGNNYKVQTEKGQIIQCRRAGKITAEHSQSQLIATGDKVIIEISEKSEELSTIVQVKKRITSLSRNSIYGNKEDIIAANADKLIIMAATIDPSYNKRLIDRMLIAADMGGLETAICINKMDLAIESLVREDLAVYERLGYKVFYISVEEQQNLQQVYDFINGSITLLSGQSGVGKSSLLNYLYGEKIQKILEISDSSGKGRHTTSNATLVKINENTSIIDTPGIREFGLWGIEAEELALMFDDFEPYRDKCKFIPCTHIHEPKCAVQEALERGEIDEERYQSYLNIYETLLDM